MKEFQFIIGSPRRIRTLPIYRTGRNMTCHEESIRQTISQSKSNDLTLSTIPSVNMDLTELLRYLFDLQNWIHGSSSIFLNSFVVWDFRFQLWVCQITTKLMAFISQFKERQKDRQNWQTDTIEIWNKNLPSAQSPFPLFPHDNINFSNKWQCRPFVNILPKSDSFKHEWPFIDPQTTELTIYL